MRGQHERCEIVEGAAPLQVREVEEHRLLARRFLARLKKPSGGEPAPETAVLCAGAKCELSGECVPDDECLACRTPMWPQRIGGGLDAYRL